MLVGKTANRSGELGTNSITHNQDCSELTREDAKSGLHDSLCPIKDYGFYITNITRKGDDTLST